MTPLDILTQGKALIDTPEKWTTNAYARNKKGQTVPIFHESSCQFCSVGAVRKVAGSSPTLSVETALDMASWFLNQAATDLSSGFMSHIQYNDAHCHANVMKMWDKAIELAKEQG